MRNTKLTSLGLLTLILALSAAPAFTQGWAKVRVILASPDAPTMDVYIDGKKQLINLPYFTVSDYFDLPAGKHCFQITPVGQPADKGVIDTTEAFEAGKTYSLAAIGSIADIQVTTLSDNLAAPAPGRARLRVIDFTPDGPRVEVKVKGHPPLASDLAFPRASDYWEVDAGHYDLQVTPAGSDMALIDLPDIRVESGKLYEVFATNMLANIEPEVEVITLSTASALPARLPTTADGAAPPPLVYAVIAGGLIVAGILVLRRRATR